ncbi:helix-turn-helix domain-containing protein [Streptomyces sp. ITFR-6]|uniref:helix-turn-helix domain-containing protein n=1 Tax=Streptomyces sp. ITFR-6 TaxID=3075197 RepID=UPI00288B1029|nr:helix-turn-helix domain-containing protein [Streptomyces sp. ITFR-6]WNI31463.1 helix-turn-helix domain-containing protein [Streptomyces sp. ITFR-6]
MKSTTETRLGADGKKYRPLLVGEARQKVVREMTEWYEAGSSIRDLVTEFDRPFGSVQRFLAEGGVVMRPRGDTRRPHPH